MCAKVPQMRKILLPVLEFVHPSQLPWCALASQPKRVVPIFSGQTALRMLCSE